MGLIEELNKKNHIKIFSVFDKEFNSYGRVLSSYDFEDLTDYLKNNTEIPEEGNLYVASVAEMESFPVVETIKTELYGDMPIQVGYCNGKNSTFNGFEYHKCSEVNIAATDFVLALGHSYQIKDNHYNNEDAKVFFVPNGTAVELFQTTLHLSPLKVTDEGYKNVVILARGTNTPLDEKPVEATGEARLLLQRNKWVIAHPDRIQLTSLGAFPGIIGENKEIFY